MRRSMGIRAVALVTLLAWTSLATAGEKDVLKALEKLRTATEAKVTQMQFRELLADAAMEINVYARDGSANRDFLNRANACFEAFEKRLNLWIRRNFLQTPRGWLAFREECDKKRPFKLSSSIRECDENYKKELRDLETELNRTGKRCGKRLDEVYNAFSSNEQTVQPCWQ